MAEPATDSSQKEGTTRERLLRVAIEMFAERGYAATGVDALCRRARVAKTGLYWEFQNKVGLLNAVVDKVVEEWAEEIRGAAMAAGHPRERLELALSAMRRRIQERPELFRVILVVLAERTQVDDEARTALRRLFESARRGLALGIQDATPTELDNDELEGLADLILAMVQGAFLRLQVFGDEAEMDRVFAGIQRAILLLVRELVANAHGLSTLVGPVRELAKPAG